MAAAGDAYWSSVAVLLNAETSASYNSKTGTTLTASGSQSPYTYTLPSRSASVVKWGADSIQFSAPSGLSSNDIKLPASGLNLTGDFTVEAWIYVTTANPDMALFGSSQGGNTQFRINHDGSGKIGLYGASSSGWLEGAASVSANTWHHVAWTRSGSTVRIYLDGTMVGSATGATLAVNLNNGAIGSLQAYGMGFTGYMDDLRITNGVARYTGSTYTVPTQAFPTG